MNRRTKYSLTFKEALVKELLSGRSGSSELSLKHGISARYLRRLAQRYQELGSLIQSNRNNFYTKDFKIACVLCVKQNQISLSEVATRLGIPSDSTLIKWVTLYNKFGEEGLKSTKMGRPKNMSGSKKKGKRKESFTTEQSALQEELKYLRAENAYLKKLSALIQQEELNSNGAKPKSSQN